MEFVRIRLGNEYNCKRQLPWVLVLNCDDREMFFLLKFTVSICFCFTITTQSKIKVDMDRNYAIKERIRDFMLHRRLSIWAKRKNTPYTASVRKSSSRISEPTGLLNILSARLKPSS